MRFERRPLVLQQPLLVFLTAAFTLGLLLAALWPDGENTSTQALPAWAWAFWLVVLAAAALGIGLLCHGEEIVIDASGRRVIQTHHFLRRPFKTNHYPLTDFTSVAVRLRIERENRGASSPTGAATLADARTVHTHRFELSLRRPDVSLQAAGGTLSAPRHELGIPLVAESDPIDVESTARALAALGRWPAFREDYRLLPESGVDRAPTVKVEAGTRERLC